ncbi:MAG: MarR family transcriptional regulator [Nitrospinaceae bacterium]|jgi:MarR family transcriptional regulator, negative regulator of the multidrug operon emrRAB|nr:MarR family transcriptional regulator [Nitrospinaceae bacterium]MBT3433404.1 MarR family transcriptional regulator [Nitrospinaceae bacterium]MBT3819805.1 MarR family transcriptional regulator [Nitrospinaceae bacterium]MBT4095228.1 MarR family transcriptional regulator [Nitrospinaceae bacterium]MBT4429375.1 MarR family transcriptional regulator [Nitrospinaceae bacterium]
MFYMRELPTRDLLDAVGQVFPELDPTAVEACYFLLRTGTDVLTAFDENLSRYNISQSRFIVLLLLKRLELREVPDGDISPSKLAELAGVSRGTMTGLLSGLERDGLIERKLYSGDRRRFSILMTEKGKKTLDNIFPEYYNRIAGLMSGLNEEERLTLIKLLNKVKDGVPSLRISNGQT